MRERDLVVKGQTCCTTVLQDLQLNLMQGLFNWVNENLRITFVLSFTRLEDAIVSPILLFPK